MITLTAAVLIAVLVSGAVTQRLRRLRQVAEQLADGDLSARAVPGGVAELDTLSRSFNSMARRIESLVTAQRGFAGDASHQLRTPLTALRLRIEQAGEDLDRDPEASRQVLDAALAEADRLQHLIDGLLMLARADGDQPPLARADLCAVVRERVEAWQPLAEESRACRRRPDGGLLGLGRTRSDRPDHRQLRRQRPGRRTRRQLRPRRRQHAHLPGQRRGQRPGPDRGDPGPGLRPVLAR